LSGLRFDLEWRLTLATALLFPCLVALGLWQLERAQEKVELQEAFAARAALPPLPLVELGDDGEGGDIAYRRVIVSGYFHPEGLVFKDNQTREGRYGMDVLGLFFDRQAQRWLLLNRGWVPADPARRSLPEVSIPGGEQRLEARVYLPPGEPFLLGEQDIAGGWPLVLQDPGAPVVLETLRERVGAGLYPHVLRLEPDQPQGFRRDWPLANSSPERHRGYALQWFTMAAVLLLLFLVRSSNIVELLRGGRRKRS